MIKFEQMESDFYLVYSDKDVIGRLELYVSAFEAEWQFSAQRDFYYFDAKTVQQILDKMNQLNLEYESSEYFKQQKGKYNDY